MHSLIRRHKKKLGWFIVITIGVPMLFFGIPAFWDTANAANDPVLAQVGDVPIYSSAYIRSLDAMASRRGGQGAAARPSFAELDASGDAQLVLEQLINSALITHDMKSRGFDVDREVLVKRMQDWQDFQVPDEKAAPDAATGAAPTRFSTDAWNTWVQNFNGNWNELYDELEDQIAREIFIEYIQAPAGRIFEDEIEEEIIANNTKMRIKYAKVDPPFELTEEQIQAEYDENPDTYRQPEQWVAEFVAVPLEPGMPQKALDVVEELRGGADFATVADEQSDIGVKNGGDMGWQIPLGENEFEHRKPLHELAVGEISDPVKGPSGYFIYTVDEERTNEETGAREVKARQIFVESKLTDEERDARNTQAESISEKAKELASLEAAAAEAGVEVQKTGQFDNTSAEIEGLPRTDATTFRAALDPDDEAKDYAVIQGRENLYVAKVIERVEGSVPPLEEVRDTVVTNAETAYKTTDEYTDMLDDYAARIEDVATSLEQAATLFPELNMEVKETEEGFTRRDFLFQQQIYLQTSQIYDKVGEAEVGTMAGPLTDFRGDTFFIELVDRQPPTEEELAELDEERERLRSNAVLARESELLNDFLQDYRERVLPNVTFSLDTQMMNDILGRNDAPASEEAATEEDVAAAETDTGA